MAVLVCAASGRRLALGGRCVIGRGPFAQLRLTNATVSAEHASIYYDGNLWKIRDLGSRNGTFVNGERIDSRTAHVLGEADRLSFGDLEDLWLLESTAPPGPRARTRRGVVIEGEGDALWLPRLAEPEACVRFQEKDWILESADGTRAVSDGDVVSFSDEEFILELPTGLTEDMRTTESTVDAGRTIDYRLVFQTSRDQEHVSLEISAGDQTLSLGARAHNYALFYLATRRLAERHSGILEPECGWVYAQDLRDALRMDRVTLNLHLWRAMQSLRKLGLPAERLVERRLDAQQLRIGFRDLVINE